MCNIRRTRTLTHSFTFAPVKSKQIKNMAVFASGTGSNAARLASHFHDHETARIALLVTNKETSGVHAIGERYSIPVRLITGETLQSPGKLTGLMHEFKIDLIVLAGFLLLLPGDLVHEFSDRILNVHPSLLPKYGGKGMYGRRVHEAVIAAGEKESGISIHLVNERYDEGAVIRQEKCPVYPSDDPASLALRVQELEHRYFPGVVEQFAKTL